MDPLEPETLTHRTELLDKGLDRPEGRVVRLVRVAAAELVVVDDTAPLLRQRVEPLERVVRAPGAAVQGEQRHPAGLLTFARDAVPRLVLLERQPAFHAAHSRR